MLRYQNRTLIIFRFCYTLTNSLSPFANERPKIKILISKHDILTYLFCNHCTTTKIFVLQFPSVIHSSNIFSFSAVIIFSRFESSSLSTTLSQILSQLLVTSSKGAVFLTVVYAQAALVLASSKAFCLVRLIVPWESRRIALNLYKAISTTTNVMMPLFQPDKSSNQTIRDTKGLPWLIQICAGNLIKTVLLELWEKIRDTFSNRMQLGKTELTLIHNGNGQLQTLN